MEREYGREGKVKRAANRSPNRKTTSARSLGDVRMYIGLKGCKQKPKQKNDISARSLGDV